MIVALDPPDFRTISDFRKRHLKALGELFLQVLKLCETAGLVKLGHVALDGTKIKANASKHKAMSYERMKKREAELKAEVACMLAAAEAADVQEDEIFGKDKRGDEMPDWASDKAKRLAKIQEAMAALEADAKLAAEEERRIEAEIRSLRGKRVLGAARRTNETTAVTQVQKAQAEEVRAAYATAVQRKPRFRWRKHAHDARRQMSLLKWPGSEKTSRINRSILKTSELRSGTG